MGNRKTLVLDLDETLVHACVDNEGSGDFTPDFSFPVSFNKQTHVINVKQRPHLQAFMERVSELFEVRGDEADLEALLLLNFPKREFDNFGNMFFFGFLFAWVIVLRS